MKKVLKSDKSTLRAWYFYDWAISAFTTTVITVLIGPYLTEIAKNAAIDGFVSILGLPVFSGSFAPYCVSLSVILQVFLLPLLGAIADYTHQKKLLLGFFAFIGAAATIGLFFLHGANYELGGLLLIISNVACGASMVIYNSYLNDIAEENERDQVSSNGYAFGYIGGGILLAINLVLIMNASVLGISNGMAIRISLASAGVWWAGFTIIPLLKLKQTKSINYLPQGQHFLFFGFKSLMKTINDSAKYPKTMLFIIAYLFFNDGVQAVIVVSSQFGREALGLDYSTLAIIILIVQFVAYFGAKFFAHVAAKYNNKIALVISLVIWVAIIFYTYSFLSTTLEFYIIGCVIGLVLGGTQALSRSLYSLLIPTGQEAEYFSLYEVSERGTSWIGPLVFGLSLQFTGSYRIAILSLGIFLVVGLLLLLKLNVKAAITEAGNTVPLNYK